MRDLKQFYINGRWEVRPDARTLDVINPATEQVAAKISLGAVEDVDLAVSAARTAFEGFSQWSREQRIDLLKAIISEYEKRYLDLAAAITEEMGAPENLARDMQAALGMAHLQTAAEVLRTYPFEEPMGTTCLIREPIGVCGLITPWNWPLNQIVAKVAPAIATGCTMVLKPSEVAPISAHVFAEVMHAASVPPGVFNLIDGTGPEVGGAISGHAGIDMVSFTGSTRAGVQVAKSAADSVKRVCQELGGKSANIMLEDADYEKGVPAAIQGVILNTGQTCSAQTRLIVPKSRLAEVVTRAVAAAEDVKVGKPEDNPDMGPLASEMQWDKVQSLIQVGIDEGARLVAGGMGKPDGLNVGYYVKPTVFADVTPDMTIAREEIFGPVLSILSYSSIDEAIAIANDSPYGLSGGVQGNNHDEVRAVASKIRTGMVHLNNADLDFAAPFGGYKQSGNGREWGMHAFAEYLETKAMMGAVPA